MKSFLKDLQGLLFIGLVLIGLLYFTGCSDGSSSSGETGDSSGDGSTPSGTVEPPELVPLPGVTDASSVMLRGSASAGADIFVQGGSAESGAVADPDSGYFEVAVQLASGENILHAYAEVGTQQSDPAEASIFKTDAHSLTLSSVDPASGRTGSILTLSGSGFSPEKETMGAYFKGELQEAEGYVLEATETSLKVVVPFVFFNTDETIQVYVYSDTEMSNSIDFQVSPSNDPTPQDHGNEMGQQFDLLLVQVERVLNKMDQLVKPYVDQDTWADIQENFNRLSRFIEDGKAEMLSAYDGGELTNLDAIFSSDIFQLINEKLDEINEILNHSTYGEAACAVGEVLGVLGDIIDIMEWVERALIAGEVICFFVCQPALPVIEVAREIVSAVLDVLQAIYGVLDAASPSNADPSSWTVSVEGPYPGTDPHVMYTEKTYNLSVYADFTNGGANEAIGGVSSIGGIVLDLLDINLGKITVEDTLVPSIVTLRPGSPTDLLEVVNEGHAANVHTINTFPPVDPENSFQGSVELDIQSSCGPYHYPDKICVGLGCLDPDLPEYPDFFTVSLIDAPIIDSIQLGTEFDASDWFVTGLGFSEQCGTVFKVYWNGEEVPCSCIEDLGYESFALDCYREPGRLSLGIVDSETAEENMGPTINMPPQEDSDLEIGRIEPQSGFIGDRLTIVGEHFSPYTEDTYLEFSLAGEQGSPIVSFHPDEIDKSNMNYNLIPFTIPEELHGYEGEAISLVMTVDCGDMVDTYGCCEAETEFDLMYAEGAAWGDQDIVAFESEGSYMRTAEVADIDGDGENDLIVGVPEYRIVWGGTGEEQVVGAVFIAFGPVNGTPIQSGQEYIDFSKIGTLGELRENWDVIIRGDFRDKDEGTGYTRRIGNTLATGDVNGDGISDLLIGTTDQDDLDQHTYNSYPGGGATHLPGKAYLFYGRSQAEWEIDNGIWPLSLGYEDILIHGDNDRELGYSVAAGDLNHDSYDDMIISAPTDSVYPNVPNDLVAKTYVIFGDGSLPSDIDVAGVPDSMDGTVLTGEDAHQEQEEESYYGSGIGKSIAVGDIDGDGINDLLLGAPQFKRVYYGNMPQGAVYVLYGDPDFGFGVETLGLVGDQDAMILGPEAGVENGTIGSAIAVGDLNNDGYGEIILGAPETTLDYSYDILTGEIFHIKQDDAGRVYVIHGDYNRHAGEVYLEELADLVIHGSTSISMLGSCLCTADVNGDGIQDLLAGAPGVSDVLPGNVWGLYGSEIPEDLTGTIQLQDRSGDPQDFLIKGDAPNSWYNNQGFGTFVTAGDLSPYVGDDLLIINPLSHCPDPPDFAGLRQYAGMLHVFYEGSERLRVIGPINIGFGEEVEGVIDNEEDDDAYTWVCITEGNVLLDVDQTDEAGNVIDSNPDSVSSAIFDEHNMIVTQGQGDINFELPSDTSACGMVLSSDITTGVNYTFTVNQGEPGQATQLTLVTDMPYTSESSNDALINVDIITDSIIAGDWDSLGDMYALWLSPQSVDAADFQIGFMWELYLRSHSNPVSEAASPVFILKNYDNEQYYELTVDFTVSDTTGVVTIDNVTGWNCGDSPAGCPSQGE